MEIMHNTVAHLQGYALLQECHLLHRLSLQLAWAIYTALPSWRIGEYV